MNKLLFLFYIFFVMRIYSVELRIAEKEIDVKGKRVKVLTLVQPDGTHGLTVQEKDPFKVFLKNQLKVPSSIHWHGLILPNNQDGVAFITQYPIYPGLSYYYEFPLVQAGTFWMHSHYSLQEQELLSAPLIIKSAEDRELADQDVVMFLTDFSFKSPREIYNELRIPKQKGMKMGAQDLVDVKYDAFLTNYHTLESPEVIQVKPGKKVRLRIINGSSATNFFILLGAMEGTAVAVDGNRIGPYRASKFELAVAQRIDIVVTVPRIGGSFPILAQGEGTNMLTGLILSTKEIVVPKLSDKAATTAGALTNEQELKLRAYKPLSKKRVDRQIVVELGGDMAGYVWTINNQVWPDVTPIEVEKGERVEILFKNKSTMSHPMHLHGHVFEVTSVGGQLIHGAKRDTVLVMPQSTVAIQFDADNPGVWPFHCHILYHMEAGMFTVLRYKNFVQPL